jgi:chromosomal replication initiator protein
MPLKDIDKRFWKRVKELAKSNMKDTTYDYLIAPAQLISVTGNDAKVLVDSNFHKDYWRRQQDLVNTASLEIYGDIINYQLLSKDELSEKDYKELNKLKQSASSGTGSDIEDEENMPFPFKSNLLKKYTFDNFIEGDQNRMTLAAAITITDDPGNLYNPLFIFGGSGLGKTHLLHAIGNEFQKKRPRAKII